MEVALRAGVQRPGDVRLLALAEIPWTDETDLREAAQEVGLIISGIGGLRQDSLGDRKLLAHELRHVAQHERWGGISGFLRQYLTQCNEYGYPDAPMELEAIAFAEKEFPSR
jgi:hypothetical protein